MARLVISETLHETGSATLPTYAYRCSSCENSYEKHEGFDAPARQPCPRCGAQAKRVIFPPPIVFKGKGFYVTDSRKSTSSMVGDSDVSNGSASVSSKKEDSKPAASASTASGDD